MTTKERLHKLVDELSDAEADDALIILGRVHERQGTQTSAGRKIAEGYERVPQTSQEDAWAMTNAREAIREERW